jgi:integrase
LTAIHAEHLDSDRAAASISSYLGQINVFLRWCERGEGPKATAQLPKVPKKLVEILTRWLEGAAKTERDKLIVRTLADAGLRLGEFLRLRRDPRPGG